MAPLFDFICPNCNIEFELFLKHANPLEPLCPQCEGILEKTVSKSNFVLKGENWAKDGYGK